MRGNVYLIRFRIEDQSGLYFTHILHLVRELWGSDQIEACVTNEGGGPLEKDGVYTLQVTCPSDMVPEIKQRLGEYEGFSLVQ